MIAIIDYGAGNLQSVKKALDYIGAESKITMDKNEINAASHIILPGVGSFGDAMASIRKRNLEQTIKENANGKKPFLGICLGLQLLFSSSEESPGVEGLGIFDGEIVRIPDTNGLKVPHIGWNSLHLLQPDCPLFHHIQENDFVYFVHSYFAAGCEDSLAATTQYGAELTAVVAKDNVFGCQFHPEKSGAVGLSILKAFCDLEV